MKKAPVICLMIVARLLASCATQHPTMSREVLESDVDTQTAAGRELYERHCERCHGPGGRDGAAPALTGPGALPLHPAEKSGMRDGPFETARDVTRFTTAQMPPGQSGRLTQPEHYAIVAYLLEERDRELLQPLTPGNADTVLIER